MKTWHWIALGVGVLVVLHYMASQAQAQQPTNPMVIGTGAGSWLRVSDPRFNFGVKL